MNDAGDEEPTGERTAASSPVSASSTVGEDALEGDDDGDGHEDIAKRRSKNRVNARRSRERKRLMLDTLQQEHWQLHQENKRIKLDNEKLKEAIETIKSLQGGGSLPPPAGGGNRGAPPLQNLGNLFQNGCSNVGSGNNNTYVASSGENHEPNNQSANAPANVSQVGPPASTGNPLMDMLAQQLMMQQQQQPQAPVPQNNFALAQLAMGGGLGSPGMNPMLTQLLLANALQQQQQQGPPGGFNPAAAAMMNPNLLSLMQQQPQQQQQQQQMIQQTQIASNNGSLNHQQMLPPASANASRMHNSAPENKYNNAPAPSNGMDGSNSNMNGKANNGNATQNLAGLLQSLGGGVGNTNNNSNNPMINQAALMNAGRPGGLASLLQALGGQQQTLPPANLGSLNAKASNGNPSALGNGHNDTASNQDNSSINV